MKNNPDRKALATFCQHIALVLVGLFCFLYSLFTSDFAEWRIETNLGFPIFVGEILLFLCLGLTAFYYYVNRRWRTPTLAVIVVYGVWILCKTYLGYQVGGPLALRTAALFYYPLFALIGYFIFDRSLWNAKWNQCVLVLLLVPMLFAAVTDYYRIVYVLLITGFLLQTKDRRWQIIGVLIVAYFAAKKGFLWTGSRSHMFGLAIMYVFLAFYYLLSLVKTRLRTKLLFISGGILLFSVIMLTYGDKNAIKSMSSIKQWQEDFAKWEEEIARRKTSFKEESLSVELFNANRDNALEKVFIAEGEAKALEAQNKNISDVQLKIIRKTADAYNAKTINEVEKLLKLREQLVYSKAKMLLEQQNKKLVDQAVAEFRLDSSRLILQIDQNLEVEVRKALRDLNMALRGDTDRSTETLRSALSEAGDDFVAQVRKAIDQKTQEIVSNLDGVGSSRPLDVAYSNIYFRLFIWRDMITDLKEYKAWWGMNWGHPQRSISLEILKWAEVEWRRDGWITPHNSMLHMIYRGGIVGAGLVIGFLYLLFSMIARFARLRSVWGGLLLASLVYWVSISNFLVFLELPYTAIPFWAFFGMTLAYLRSLEKQIKRVKK